MAFERWPAQYDPAGNLALLTRRKPILLAQQRLDALTNLSGPAFEDRRIFYRDDFRRWITNPSPKPDKAGKAGAAPDDGSRLVEQLLGQVRGTMDLTEVEKLRNRHRRETLCHGQQGQYRDRARLCAALDKIKETKEPEEAADAAKARADEYQRIFDATRTPLETSTPKSSISWNCSTTARLVRRRGHGTVHRAVQKAGEKFQSLTDKDREVVRHPEEFAKSAARTCRRLSPISCRPFARAPSMPVTFGDTVQAHDRRGRPAQLMRRCSGIWRARMVDRSAD